MSTPFQNKSESMKNALKQLFPEMYIRATNGYCPFCGKPISANDFADEKYLREYEISGLCAKCQDEIFQI